MKAVKVWPNLNLFFQLKVSQHHIDIDGLNLFENPSKVGMLIARLDFEPNLDIHSFPPGPVEYAKTFRNGNSNQIRTGFKSKPEKRYR